jgi:hypothetical protein
MQITVARTKPALTLSAMIIGPLQQQRPQYALKRLSVAAMILGGCSAGARQFRTHMIGGVGVEALFQCPCSQTQSLPSCGYFNSFEIQISDGLAA